MDTNQHCFQFGATKNKAGMNIPVPKRVRVIHEYGSVALQ